MWEGDESDDIIRAGADIDSLGMNNGQQVKFLQPGLKYDVC